MEDLANLPNQGKDMKDFREEMKICLDVICKHEKNAKTLAAADMLREEWTEFFDNVFQIQTKQRVTKVNIGQAMIDLYLNNITDLEALSLADDIEHVELPHRLKLILTDCKKLLDIRKIREALVATEGLGEFSRLVVEKTTNIEKISYLTVDGGLEVIWERRRGSADHNLDEAASDDEEVPLDCTVNVGDLIADVSGQFDADLLNRQIRAIKDETLWQELNVFSSYGGNRGEVVFQQAVYPPFTLVLLAAASPDSKYVYVADQDVLSSSFVMLDGEKHMVNGQPDAGLMLMSKDPMAEIEIKSSEKLNHQDLSKCILWSSITGQALQEIGVPLADIALPFVIGSGFLISLFVTRFPHENDTSRPKVICMHNQVSLLNAAKRIKVFVDFVLLVGKMKIAHEKGATDNLRKRRKTKAGYKNLFSSTKKKKPNKSDDDDDDDDTNEMDLDSDSKKNERKAMMAVSQVCPTSLELKFPWPRVPCLFDEEQTSLFRQHSPFFFRGQFLGSPAFFKVWRLGDADVVESFIQDEARLLKGALDTGVSVPSILYQGFTAVNGSRYFVLAMEDAGSTQEVANYDELVSYSLSLLQNTQQLHSTATILHCDLKPDNVIWDADQKEIKMIDFGHAQEEKKASCVRGTNEFMAPEIDRGEVNTRASDAYSVGATLHFLQEEVPEADQLGIRAIAAALMRPNPKRRISLDQAYRKLVAAQMERDQPTERHSKKVKTGEADKKIDHVLYNLPGLRPKKLLTN